MMPIRIRIPRTVKMVVISPTVRPILVITCPLDAICVGDGVGDVVGGKTGDQRAVDVHGMVV